MTPSILDRAGEAHSSRASRRLASQATLRRRVRASRALHQILFADCAAEAIVVIDELADELMHPLLENLLHAAVLKPRPHRASVALGWSLAAIGARDMIQIDHEILVAARQRTRHFIAQDQEVGDEPRLHALPIDPVVGGQRRYRA